mmetsp:Transcript_27041/g.23874  ORF Transcript_27041/g.23874 Transcript_27041/m.23874 type:complete len:126 (+) Transcript_27041:724-1101(+)
MLIVMVFMFLVITINNKLCFTFSLYHYFEQIIVKWAIFIILANLYGASVFIEFLAISTAIENYDLGESFPDYAEIYFATYRQFLSIAILYPFAWIGWSYFGYIKSQYFRNMIYLIEIEILIFLIL